MKYEFIMTAFGKDRPGIVADVSQLIFENNCNLEDSTMTLLAGEFTIMLLFSGRDEGLEDRLLKDCRRLELEKGVTAFIHPVTPETAGRQATSCTRHTLTVEGIDHAGIVYNVSRYLAQKGVNITDLRSRLDRSPESGAPYYSLSMHIEMPEDCSLDALQDGLSLIENDLHVDIHLS